MGCRPCKVTEEEVESQVGAKKNDKIEDFELKFWLIVSQIEGQID